MLSIPNTARLTLLMATYTAMVVALFISHGCALETDGGDEEGVDVGVTSEALTYSAINSNNGASLASSGSEKLACLRAWTMQWNTSLPGNNVYTCSGDTCSATNGTDHSGPSWTRAKGCWDFFSPNGTPEFKRECTIETGLPAFGFGAQKLLLYTPGYSKCAFYPLGGGSRWGEGRINESKMYVPPPAATKNMKQPPPPPPGTGGMNCPGGLMVGPGICAN